MKLRKAYIGLLFAVLFLAACGSGKTSTAVTPSAVPPSEVPTTEVQPTEIPPTATATAAPTSTEAPIEVSDPAWDRIQSTGKIIFGTSADYQPFEYYDSNFQIIGFDAAIARELALRLGVQVELVDMAFEGLTTAVQIGQVDAAIAALSITPERQAVVEFTNVYYTGQDSVLARQGSGIGKITTPVQLAQYRVGVQRGTTYQTWVQKNLVDTGLMPSANLLAYEKPEHAVRDLKDNRNDVVLMGTVPAQEYLLTGGLEIVGQSLNSQFFGIALPQGSDKLKTWMNSTLSQMANDGTLNRFAQEYLLIDLSKVPPVPTPTPLPTTVVIPTATPQPCYDAMAYVGDVTIPDGTEMNPGQDFDKIWRLKNTGTCPWNSSYKITYVQGDRMDGTDEFVKGTILPGQTYDMIIDQKAPNNPGTYQGVWQMVNAQNVPFGQRIWVNIVVPAPTPVPPTATPVPPVQPTLAPKPVIDSFTATPQTVSLGEVIILSWSFSGENIVSARLTRTDPDGTIVPLYGGADVPTQGTYEDLAMKPGTVNYTLTVSSEFNGTTASTIIVTVNP
jgi:ABC-type amino acid transport substrate-binding protein